jgi:hypothetical protein
VNIHAVYPSATTISWKGFISRGGISLASLSMHDYVYTCLFMPLPTFSNNNEEAPGLIFCATFQGGRASTALPLSFTDWLLLTHGVLMIQDDSGG